MGGGSLLFTPISLPLPRAGWAPLSFVLSQWGCLFIHNRGWLLLVPYRSLRRYDGTPGRNAADIFPFENVALEIKDNCIICYLLLPLSIVMPRKGSFHNEIPAKMAVAEKLSVNHPSVL
jgi:hypothetical protein